MTEDEGVAQSVARDLTQTMDASKKTPLPQSLHPVTSPFGQVSAYKSKEEFADTIGLLISDHLNKDDTTKASLISAVESYFDVIGISNDDELGVMDEKDWPLPDSETPQKHLKIPVLRCLKTVASHTRKIRRANHYLRPHVTFEDLSEFSSHLETTSQQNSSQGSNPPSKLPNFDVPIFSGEAADASDYLDEVKNVFASNAVGAYLTDSSVCDTNPDWSNALASRLRSALRKNKILNFLATEQEDVKRCCQVYQAMEDHLSTMDLHMFRTFELWLKFFDLKCDSMDTFLEFYSGVRASYIKLERHDSVAIKDDTFIRAFLCRALNVPELQNTTKELTLNSNMKVMEIFDSVFKEYNGLITSSALRDTDMALTRSSRRAEVKSGTRRGEVKGKPTVVSRFPPNSGNLIPQKVYDQVKIWFDEMTKPKDKRDPNFHETFKFVAHKQPVKIVRQGYLQPRTDKINKREQQQKVARRSTDRTARRSTTRDRSRSSSPEPEKRSSERTSRRSKRSGQSDKPSSRKRDRPTSPAYSSSDSSGGRSPVSGSRNLLGTTYSEDEYSVDLSSMKEEVPKKKGGKKTGALSKKKVFEA